MKRIIKLLLLAALAWPSIAAAQGQADVGKSAPRPRPLLGHDTEVCAEDTHQATKSAAVSAQSSNSPGGPHKTRVRDFHYVTVADGSDYSPFAPVYGYYYDNYSSTVTYSQMIYPASMLAEAGMTGKTIRGITFYAPEGIQFSTEDGDGVLTCTLGRTATSAFGGSSVSTPSTTISATLTPKKGDKELVFEFESGIVCNATSNIWVEVRVTTAGTDDASNELTQFIGKSQTGYTSYNYCYNSDRSGYRKFLPKASFKLLDNSNFYSIDNESLDFGAVQCGTSSAVQNVTITNNRSTDVSLSWAFKGASASKFSTSLDGNEVTSIPAKGSVTFPIVFKPGSTTGTMLSSLRVYLDNTVFHIALRGKGVKDYDASVTPGALDLGEVLVNGDRTATVTLANTGQNAITPVASCDNEAFSVLGNGTGILEAGAMRDYTITFAPTAEQSYTGSLTIRDESNGVSLKVDLAGKGVITAAPYVVESVQGESTSPEITVCDVETSSQYVPLLTNYMDWGTESQMIYPEGMLKLNVGDKITSITFYATSNLTPSDGLDDNLVTVKVGTTAPEVTQLSGLITEGLTTELTTVCTRSIWTGNNTVTFTFSEPFVYTGGNLLLDLSCAHTSGAYYASKSWYAAAAEDAGYCQTLNSSGTDVYTSKTGIVSALPKMTLGIDPLPVAQEYVRVDAVDWGAKNAGSFYSKVVTICNPNSEAVNATLSTTEQFYFNNTGKTSQTASLPAGNSTLTLYFNPTAAAAYTGSLTITVKGHSSSTRLTGVGLKAGEIATRDSSFFASKTYDWTDSDGRSHTNNLAEIATDPDQIIAMLTKVYTDKSIPGNYKRGFTTSGGSEVYDDVAYTGVGEISYIGDGTYYNSKDYYEYSDGYGWNIPGDIVYGGYNSNSEAYFAYMDSTQYKPDYEGLTLLLVEMRDEFDINDYVDIRSATYDTPKQALRACIEGAIKSVRTINVSKRTGEGYDMGTLFKLDCDKLNKFCIIAKGQVRYPFTSQKIFSAEGYWRQSVTFCRLPCYAYSTMYNYRGDESYDGGGFWDENCFEPFYHMFEQFSPYDLETLEEVSDVYQTLVGMQSYAVPHDCASVPAVAPSGHHFRMYGEDSEAADCQDVRDMMFFVPDYRMMYDSKRDGQITKFLNYNTGHRPRMGLYVIHQDAVQGQKVSGKDLYDLTLTWKSNMDEFLPRDQQEYQLYQLITDEFGDEHWEPVYYRNDNGEYTDSLGNEVGEDNKVPITLSRAALTSTTARHTYNQVYIDQKSSGQTVTFAVRGQDADHFLSLQMSNEESFFIPGTDPTELLHTTSATYYSRFEPQEVRNCYSNKIKVEASPNSIRTDYFDDETEFEINRTWYEQVDGTTVPHTVKVATARVTDQKSYLTITVDADTQSPESMFPKGKSDGAGGRAAGYHANPETYKVPISLNQYDSNEYASFSFVVWDNFVADVSKNEHPGQYVYEVVFTAKTTIANASTTQGHSNRFSVPVYKTDSRISEPRTLAEVLGDTQMNPDYSPGDVAFDAQVQYSSKQNILRYDAYRWNEGEDRYVVDQVYSSDDEQDLPPTGIAGNQGESYSVTMNAIGSDDYYVGSAVPVNTTNTTNWATFVDYYPTNAETEAGAYVYAPVVELFTRGKKADDASANREDYNTYGGPLQNTAVGKLAVKPHQPENGDYALMSNYWWMGDGTTGVDGEKYSYYNITLDYEALDVPEGYELYKVRAWRKVDKSVLGEILPTRREVRIGQIDADGWYLFEDMNYGDSLNVEGTKMALDRLYDRDDQMTLSPLGARSARIARPINPDGTGGGAMFGTETGTTVTGQTEEEAVTGELRATFGARRLDLNGEDNDFSRLDAQFKVRAYFTRKSNPLIAGKTGHAPIYVLGNSANSTSWNPSAPLGTLYSYDGNTYVGNVTVNDTNDGNDAGYGFLSFATKTGTWDEVNQGSRFGWTFDDDYWVGESDFGKELNLTYESNTAGPGNFRIAAGTYNLVVKMENGLAKKLVIGKGALRAPRRAGETAMTGSDYDYYIAEGECEFHQDGGSGVVTGIDGVKADLSREVESVNYVNTIGQVSNRPWQGVNVVVTRYTDGTTKTTKAVY